MSCRCRGASERSRTEIFQFWTSLSASQESPRAISVAMTENVCASVAASSPTPP